eukprot:CAMPEP_0178950126 /NCGR_PEP_ID=MMETSP0789-20121207/6466_1 /TAXON_ID=3005 /ORGANISM="Rhizosolenia setigera, Strain CCMP 1694" /LENGTH=360 /DNA_ID=CAMNT_0020630791 /DNA_START=152 /DNA_END=1231 /DNA_ORIENTATION=+
MAHSTSEDRLPQEHQKILDKAGIKIKYLPKPRDKRQDTFFTTQLDKFRILTLVEYNRVIYMDSDVMPMCSLDLFFDLSDPNSPLSILKENTVIAYENEPSSGGIFMLKPNIQDFEDVQQIINRYTKRYLTSWQDDEIGWGHIIKSPDKWIDVNGKSGNDWSFYGGFADQGLLYFYTKYFKKDVSIINGNRVETWSGDPIYEYNEEKKENVLISKEINKGLHYAPKFNVLGKGCSPYREKVWLLGKRSLNIFPYVDFVHFTGDSKPWYSKKNFKKVKKINSAEDLWYSTLIEESKRLKFKIPNFQDFEKQRLFPIYHDIRIYAQSIEEEKSAATKTTSSSTHPESTGNEKSTSSTTQFSPS